MAEKAAEEARLSGEPDLVALQNKLQDKASKRFEYSHLFLTRWQEKRLLEKDVEIQQREKTITILEGMVAQLEKEASTTEVSKQKDEEIGNCQNQRSVFYP